MPLNEMDRKKEEYYATRQEAVIDIVPEGTRRILEVGCGAGLTGKAIKNRSGKTVEVTGIEIEPDIAEKAKGNIDRVLTGNAETLELHFEKGYFDCIIYANILEHLIDPWALLARHREFLSDDGYVVASIPNIAHYRIIKMLKRKEWNYEDMGILDNTHLRFFTIKSIKKMFGDCDLEIIKTHHRIGASNVKKFLNRLFFGALLDCITEEYTFLAKKAGK